jgi:hypothetical protein
MLKNHSNNNTTQANMLIKVLPDMYQIGDKEEYVDITYEDLRNMCYAAMPQLSNIAIARFYQPNVERSMADFASLHNLMIRYQGMVIQDDLNTLCEKQYVYICYCHATGMLDVPTVRSQKTRVCEFRNMSYYLLERASHSSNEGNKARRQLSRVIQYYQTQVDDNEATVIDVLDLALSMSGDMVEESEQVGESIQNETLLTNAQVLQDLLDIERVVDACSKWNGKTTLPKVLSVQWERIQNLAEAADETEAQTEEVSGGMHAYVKQLKSGLQEQTIKSEAQRVRDAINAMVPEDQRYLFLLDQRGPGGRHEQCQIGPTPAYIEDEVRMNRRVDRIFQRIHQHTSTEWHTQAVKYVLEHEPDIDMESKMMTFTRCCAYMQYTQNVFNV